MPLSPTTMQAGREYACVIKKHIWCLEIYRNGEQVAYMPLNRGNAWLMLNALVRMLWETESD